ncbi:MAG: hypothetical protein ACP5E3_10030, partial [Bacteroidales bacterium]
AAIWAGVIDDLWKIGKPTGRGGPWKNSEVLANEPSDPYLIGFYDKRSLLLTHNSNQNVIFRLEVEPIGHGPWMKYMEIEVKAGEEYTYQFPDDFEARWIRFITDSDTRATTFLVYE